MKFKIDMDAGVVRSLWTDAIELPGLGRVDITRASNVEYNHDYQAWFCYYPTKNPDLIPGQPAEGFRQRKDALAWEVRWAEENL